MCIIVLDTREGTSRLERSILKRCENRNPDGMGIMWAAGGKLHTFKTLKDFNAIWNRYTSARDAGLKVAVHFRKNTKGDTTLDNCHPFEVWPGEFAFMHNGTVTCVKSMLDQGESDTARMCKVFQRLPGDFLNDPVLYDMVKSYVRGDRLLFMDNEGRHTIINAYTGKWEIGNKKDGGVWFSHTRDSRYFMTGKTYLTAAESNYHGIMHRREAARKKWDGDGGDKSDKLVNGRRRLLSNLKYMNEHKRLVFIYGDLRDDLQPLAIDEDLARYASTGVVHNAKLTAICPDNEPMVPVMELSSGDKYKVHGIVIAAVRHTVDALIKDIQDLLPKGYYHRGSVPVNIGGDQTVTAHTFIANPSAMRKHSTILIPDGDWRMWLEECALTEWQLGVYDDDDDEEIIEVGPEELRIEDSDEDDDRDPDTECVIDLVDRMKVKGQIIQDPFTDNYQCPSPRCDSFDTHPYPQLTDEVAFGSTQDMLWCNECQKEYVLPTKEMN